MVYSSYTYRGYRVEVTRSGSSNTVWIYNWEVKEPASVSRPLTLGSGSEGTPRAVKQAANQFIDQFIFGMSGTTPGGYKSPGELLAAYKAGAISELAAVQYLLTYFGYSQTQAYLLLNEDDTDDEDPISDFEPHMMYDCKTGKSYQANTKADHDKYSKLGYVHDMSECKIENGDSENEFALVGLLMGLWLVSKVI